MNEGKYKIYALIDPETEAVRYVGYTGKPLSNRLAYHYYDISKNINSHKTNWLKKLQAKGLQAKIEIIEDGIVDLSKALEKEIYWISQFPNLTNSTSGGETNKTYCPEVLLKMSINRRGKAVGADNPMFGKCREDLRLRNLNNNPAKNPETAKRIGSKLKALYNTPEYLQIQRDAQTTCKAIVQKDKVGNVVTTFQSLREAALLGFGRKEIKKCCDGIYKQHKGYLWEYKTENCV